MGFPPFESGHVTVFRKYRFGFRMGGPNRRMTGHRTFRPFIRSCNYNRSLLYLCLWVRVDQPRWSQIDITQDMGANCYNLLVRLVADNATC